LPAAAWAQSSITGVVRDTSGGVLPGVTVEAASPALIEKVRSVATDGQGVYTIVDLRPGLYTVTFTLSGFRTLRREGIELPANFTATVNAELAVGALEETVTVSGESPIVDIRSSRAQSQYSTETLSALPGTGRVASLVYALPGAVLGDEGNRGGGGLTDRGQTWFSVHGAPVAQPVVDGMNNELAAANRGVHIYNQLALQEVVIETSGIGADRDTGGAQINMIYKDGGNTFSGIGNFAYTTSDLESSNLNDALRARGLREGLGAIKMHYDVGAGMGGPLRRDRLWFFGAARRSVNQQYATGVYWNKLRQPESLLYEPDLARGPAFSDDFYRDYSARLTWQAAQKHKIVLTASSQHNCNCVYNLLQATANQTTPESATIHEYEPNYNALISWTYPATNQLLFTLGGGANHVTQTDRRGPEVVTERSIEVTEQSLALTYGAAYGPTIGGASYSSITRSQYHQQVAVSYITGSHNFKAGLNAREFRTGDQEKYGHDLYMANLAIKYTFNNQRPVSLQLLATPHHTQESGNDIALYAQDDWAVRRLTVNLGVRYNEVDTSTPDQVLPAGFFVPERRFAAAKHIPHWRNLSPRLGGAYDLFGTGRTAIKASLGRYPDIIRATTANPTNQTSLTTNRSWNDSLLGAGDPRTGNYVPDCDLLNPVANGECGAFSDLNFGKPILSTRLAEDALTGFNKQAYHWQGSVSFQHELRPGFGLNIGYFRTWYGGFLVTDNLAVTPADYDPYCITAPVDSRLPTSGQQLCGLYDLNPAKFGPVDNLVTQASHYGKRTQVYNGVDLTLNARFGRGGQFSGGLSLGRTVQDNCLVVDSPEAARPDFCKVVPPWSSITHVKFLAIYPLPWDIQTSAIFQNVPGIPIRGTYVVPNAQVASSLGRSLSGGRRNVTISLIPDNSEFEDRLTQVDLRFSRLFRLGEARRLRGSLDMINVFNASMPLRTTPSYGAAWMNVLQALNGRLLKVSAQFDF
jgi:hypothetical protein